MFAAWPPVRAKVGCAFLRWLLEGKFKRHEIVIARMQPDDIRQFLARSKLAAVIANQALARDLTVPFKPPNLYEIHTAAHRLQNSALKSRGQQVLRNRPLRTAFREHLCV